MHILHHAAEGELYGQWMIEELAGHGYRLSPGTLYPILHAMERKGYLKSRSGTKTPASIMRMRIDHSLSPGDFHQSMDRMSFIVVMLLCYPCAAIRGSGFDGDELLGLPPAKNRPSTIARAIISSLP